MPQDPNKLSQLWQELKRRKVSRVITVYAAAAFVILELVDIIADPLKLPEWFMPMVIVLLCIGFVIAVILSWIYDVHPEGGIVKTEPAHKVKTEEAGPPSSRGWKIASYISFVVIVGLIVLNIIPRTKRVIEKEILEKSIAVLPFINDSEDIGNEHIINGIMEEILINLQSIKELRVPGRTSVEQYRNNPKPIPEIASEMNVAYIVEGSGQRYGNKIRLRVQLVEGASDKHLWADLYDEEINGPEDIFRIQSQIAKSIAAELQAVITPEEEELIEKIPTTNLTAYDFYQRGREEQEKYWLDSDNRDALERAEDLYHEALEYDSTFAKAYTGLARVYRSKHYSETYYTENFLDSVLILADCALSFDDQLSDAYVIRGDYYRAHKQSEQAIYEYDKAIKLNPNDFEAYFSRGGLYSNTDLVNRIDNYQKAASLHRGSFLPIIYRSISKSYAHAGFKEKSKYYVKEALKLDDDSAAYYSYLGEIEDCNGNFEKAIEFLGKSYAIDSTDLFVIRMLGQAHMYIDQFKESLEYYQKYEQRFKTTGRPITGGFSYLIGYAYLANEFKEEAEYSFNTGLEYYNKLVELDRGYGNNYYYNLAAIYAFRGDKDKAYEFLRLINQRQSMPLFVIKNYKNNPLFDSIRDEAEFQQFLQDVEAKYQAEHERVRKWLEENEML